MEAFPSSPYPSSAVAAFAVVFTVGIASVVIVAAFLLVDSVASVVVTFVVAFAAAFCCCRCFCSCSCCCNSFCC